MDLSQAQLVVVGGRAAFLLGGAGLPLRRPLLVVVFAHAIPLRSLGLLGALRY